MKLRTAWLALMLAPSLAMVSVSAAATTYNLAGGCTTTSGFKNNSLVAGAAAAYLPGTCTGAGALTSITAISDTGTGGALQTAYIGVYGSNLGVTSTAGITNAGTASIYDGSTGTLANGTTVDTANGITSESTAAPQHAMDNSYNREAMLLTFNTAVSLTSLSLGYYDTDSDLTIYAYTASQGTVANTGLLGSTYSTLAGWTKIGDYADAYSSVSVANTTLSSYWLIAAYTGTATGTGAGTLSKGNDFVKLLTASACAGAAGCGFSHSGVPEPSSLLLAGIALFGLTELRRRQTI